MPSLNMLVFLLFKFRIFKYTIRNNIYFVEYILIDNFFIKFSEIYNICALIMIIMIAIK